MRASIQAYSALVMAPARYDISRFAVMRRACALLALFALFLQGSSGGHVLLVEHTRCAEHGELVHGQPAHLHVATAHEEAEAKGPTFKKHAPASEEEPHGHCALCADRRDAVAEVDAPQLRLGFARITAPLLTEDPALVLQSRRFRIAPKNSPPA
jgi:hypothetical protein